MRAMFRKTLLLGACTVAGSLGVGLLSIPEAKAQLISPCMILGSPMPPPCITFDYKRLADIATKQAQEVQKVKAKIEEVKGWASTQSIMGKVNEALNTDSLVDRQFFQGIPQTAPDATATTTFAQSKLGTTKYFADAGATNDQVTQIAQMRNTAARAASVDGMSMAWQKGGVLKSTVDDAKRIKIAACKSTDLRTDWAVNSEAKRALAQARTTQNYLWQAYLQLYSSGQITQLPITQGKAAMPPSASTGAPAAPVDNGDLARLQRIAMLALEAESILDLLERSRSADQLQSIVSVAKTDCADTQMRKANLDAQLPAKARQLACNADKCRNGTVIESGMKSTLSRWETQMTSLRSQSIEALAGEFRKRQLDVNQLMSANTDPRQFIGTWSDPAKYDMLTSIANNLANGRRDQYNNGTSLDRYIDGDRDTRAFAQMLYDWEDVRQEVAWKFAPRINGEEGTGGSCTEASFSESEVGAIKAEAQNSTGTKLTQTDVSNKLKEIAKEGDDLGAALTQSTDPNTIEAARGQLARLQDVLNRGTQLPDHTGFDPSQCQAAADYASSQGVQMTAAEMQACLNGSSNPSSPYYVSR